MNPSNDRLLQSVLDLLWAQWTAIGVAGVRASRASVVDPEALVVATAEFGRWDARLFDEMLDWLVVNAARVDLVRLKRLVASAPVDTRRLVAAIAEFVATREGRRPWRALVNQPEAAPELGEPSGTAALFTSPNDAQTWGELDQVFLAHGFERNPPVLRGMSQAPDAVSPACLRFRARGLAGVGARAEVLTYLWTHEWGHGRLIAERALYAKTAVAQYLSDLSTAKLVARRESGKQVLYRLEPALAALGRPTAAYVDWPSTLRGVALIWRELQQWPAGGEVGHKEASRLAQALGAAAPDLASEGFEHHIPDLRGWAAREGDIPVRVVEEVAQRVDEFVQ
jgi:hypothetical protein